MSDNAEERIQVTDLEVKRFELETKKFEFEKESEERKQKLQRWDTWGRYFGSALISGVILLAVTIYQTRVERAETKRAEANRKSATERADANRKSEMLVQMLNARESADSSLRARMFEALLKDYFKKEDDISKITILEMIALNFRDSVQVKPLFKHLDRELKVRVGNKAVDYTLLHKAAKRVIADQLKEIRHSQYGEVCSYELQEGEGKTPDCFPPLVVRLARIADDGSAIKVRVNSKDGKVLDKEHIGLGDEFSVTYYDMPMTDYTVITEGAVSWRYSIVLENIDLEANKAKVAIALLPADSYSTQQEYKFDEAIAEYLHPSDSSSISVEPQSTSQKKAGVTEMIQRPLDGNK